MPFRLVTPRARSSAMIGARSAALATARAVRALSAMLGARWPKWRPVGIPAVCQLLVNSSATLSPRDSGFARVGAAARRKPADMSAAAERPILAARLRRAQEQGCGEGGGAL
jgi:hypothetical protein